MAPPSGARRSLTPDDRLSQVATPAREEPLTGRWNPCVSVVIATHNRPELLAMAVQGVILQDYAGEIECVIVFDQAEPDLTLARPRAGSPVRSVRVVSNVRSQGLAGARNTGVVESTGELVSFCDDDDEWMQGKVQAQVEALNGDGALTCVTGIRIIYSDRETVRVPTTQSVTLAALIRHRTMEAHPSTVMVRRDALMGPIGLVDEQIPGSYAEDFDWILRAAKAGPIAVVEQGLVKVRWGQSLFSRNWQTIIDAIDYLFDKHEELLRDRQGRARLLGRRAFALAALGRRREALQDAAVSARLSLAGAASLPGGRSRPRPGKR